MTRKNQRLTMYSFASGGFGMASAREISGYYWTAKRNEDKRNLIEGERKRIEGKRTWIEGKRNLIEKERKLIEGKRRWLENARNVLRTRYWLGDDKRAATISVNFVVSRNCSNFAGIIVKTLRTRW